MKRVLSNLIHLAPQVEPNHIRLALLLLTLILFVLGGGAPGSYSGPGGGG